MFLFIRLALYLFFGMVAGQGLDFIVFDDATGEISITFNVSDVEAILYGVFGWAATIASSRWAKAKGWLT